MVEQLARDVIADPGSGLGASLDRFAGRLTDRMGGFGLARTPAEGALTRRVLDRWTLPNRVGGLSVFDVDALGYLDRDWAGYEGYDDVEFGGAGSFVIPVDPVEHPMGLSARRVGSRRRSASLFTPVSTARRSGARPPRPRERWRPVHDSQTLSPYPAALGRAGAVDANLLRFPDARATLTSNIQRRPWALDRPTPQTVLTAPAASAGWGHEATQLAPAAAAAEAVADRVGQPMAETTPVATWLLAAEAPSNARETLSLGHQTRRATAHFGRFAAHAVPDPARALAQPVGSPSDLGALVEPSSERGLAGATPQGEAAAAIPTARPASLFSPTHSATDPARSRAHGAPQGALIAPAGRRASPQTPFVPAALGGLLRDAAAPAVPARQPVQGRWASPVRVWSAVNAQSPSRSGVASATNAQSPGRSGAAFVPAAVRAAQRADAALAEAHADGAAAETPPSLWLQTGAPGALIQPGASEPRRGPSAATAADAASQGAPRPTAPRTTPAAAALGGGVDRPGGAPSHAQPLIGRPAAAGIGAGPSPADHATQSTDPIARALTRAGEGESASTSAQHAVLWRSPVAPPGAVRGAATALVEGTSHLGRFLAGLRGPAMAEEAAGGGRFFGFDVVGTLVDLARARLADPAGQRAVIASSGPARPGLFEAARGRGPSPHAQVAPDGLARAPGEIGSATAVGTASTGGALSAEVPSRPAQGVEAWIDALASLSVAAGEPALAPRGAVGRLAAFVESVTRTLRTEAWLTPAGATPSPAGAMGPAGVLVEPATPTLEGAPLAGTASVRGRTASTRRPSLFRSAAVTRPRSGGRARRAVRPVGQTGASATHFAARISRGPEPASVQRRPFVAGAPGALIRPDLLTDSSPVAATAGIPALGANRPGAVAERPALDRRPAVDRRPALDRLPANVARMLSATASDPRADGLSAVEGPIGATPPSLGRQWVPTPGAPTPPGVAGALVAPSLDRKEAPPAGGAIEGRPAARRVVADRSAPGRGGVRALDFTKGALAVFRGRLFESRPALAAAVRSVAQGRLPSLTSPGRDEFPDAPAEVGEVVRATGHAESRRLQVSLSAAGAQPRAPRSARWVPSILREVLGALPSAPQLGNPSPSRRGGPVIAPDAPGPGRLVSPRGPDRAALSGGLSPTVDRAPTFGRPTLAPGNVDRALVAFGKAAQAEAARGGAPAAAAAAGLPAGFGGPIGALFAPGELPRPSMGRVSNPTARPSIRLPGGLFGDRGPSVSVGPAGAHASRVMIETGARTAVEQALRSTPGQRPQQQSETAEEARHRNADQSEDSLSPEEIERIARDIITMLEREAEFDLDRLGEDYD